MVALRRARDPFPRPGGRCTRRSGRGREDDPGDSDSAGDAEDERRASEVEGVRDDDDEDHGEMADTHDLSLIHI